MARRKSSPRLGQDAMFSRNPAPMWVQDRETRAFLDVNAAAARLLGRPRRRLLSMTLDDLGATAAGAIPDPPAIPAPPGSSPPLVRRLLRADGAVIDVAITTRACRFGRREAELASAFDITPLVHGERLLRNAAAKWRTTFDAMTDAIAWLDTDGRVVRCNRALARLAQKDFGQILGRRCAEVLEGTLEPLAGCPVEEVLATQRLSSGSLRLGSRSFHVVANPVFDEEGRFLGAVHVIADITAQHRAEEAVRDSERRLRAIFDSSPEGILLADPETMRFSFGNRRICEMLGYRPEEIATLGVLDIHPAESIPRVTEQFRRQARGEIAVSGDLPVLRRDGSVFHASISTSRVRYAGREYLAGFFTDVTRRRAAEAARDERMALAEFERDIGHALNAEMPLDDILGMCTGAMIRHLGGSTARIWTSSPGGANLVLRAASGPGLASRGAEACLPDPAETAAQVGRTLRPVLSNPSDGAGCTGSGPRAGGPEAFAAYPLLVAGRLSGVVVFTLGVFLSDFVLTALESAAGTLAQGIERIQAEEALQRYSKELSALTSVSNSLLALASFGDLYDEICWSAERVFGADLVWLGLTKAGSQEIEVAAFAGAGSSYLEGLSVRWDDSPNGCGPTGTAIKTGDPQSARRDSSHFAPWRQKAERCGFESSLAVPLVASTGSGACLGALNLYSREAEFFSPDRVRLCQVFANQAAVAIENMRLMTGLELEVAKRTGELEKANLSLLELNRELEANYARLKEIERLRDSLVRMVVHDLRSPLAAVAGFLFILNEEERERLSGPGLIHLGRARRAADLASEMVGTVLDISRLEAGRMELATEACDLDVLAREVVSRVEALRGGRELCMEASGVPAVVEGDRQLLSRVIQNLVSNAIDFTDPATGRIVVSLEIPDSVARLAVCDNGAGIPPEDLDKVFDKHWQGGAPRRERRGSSGLGLAFCKLAIEAHGGRIGVESEPGRGSRFWFEVSLAGAGRAPAPEA